MDVGSLVYDRPDVGRFKVHRSAISTENASMSQIYALEHLYIT